MGTVETDSLSVSVLKILLPTPRTVNKNLRGKLRRMKKIRQSIHSYDLIPPKGFPKTKKSHGVS